MCWTTRRSGLRVERGSTDACFSDSVSVAVVAVRRDVVEVVWVTCENHMTETPSQRQWEAVMCSALIFVFLQCVSVAAIVRSTAHIDLEKNVGVCSGLVGLAMSWFFMGCFVTEWSQVKRS